MVTSRYIVYYILDLLKLESDDSTFTEDHILFTLSKYRAFILEQQALKNILKIQNPDNYQTICIDLEQFDAFESDICGSNLYLRSTKEIPGTLDIGTKSVYPVDYYLGGKMSLVSMERMRYVGSNKYLKNIIYCSIGPDKHLYFTSSNANFLELKKVKMTAIFANYEDADSLSCDSSEKPCDILDQPFPLEESLIPQVIELVMKEIAGPSWKPKDDSNNASDDLASLATYIAKNTKSDLQKKLVGDA